LYSKYENYIFYEKRSFALNRKTNLIGFVQTAFVVLGEKFQTPGLSEVQFVLQVFRVAKGNGPFDVLQAVIVHFHVQKSSRPFELASKL